MALTKIYINIKGRVIEKIIGATPTENNFTDTEKTKLSIINKITISPTEPSNPVAGDIWIQTT